jgi:hypothetical protein
MLRLSYRAKSRQKTVTLPSWAFGLVAAGSAALGIALFLVVSTLAVLLLPLVLIAGAVTAFIMRKRIDKLLKTAGIGQPSASQPRRRAAQAGARDEIEDVEYRIVEEPVRKPSPESPRRSPGST